MDHVITGASYELPIMSAKSKQKVAVVLLKQFPIIRNIIVLPSHVSIRGFLIVEIWESYDVMISSPQLEFYT